MSDKTIRVELTEDEARAAAKVLNEDSPYNVHSGAAADKIRAALPPEYAEGTVARVTLGHLTFFAERKGGEWVAANGTPFHGAPSKVEPLRVLADDELAVNLGSGLDRVTAEDLTRAAKWLRKEKGWINTPAFLERTADRLDAETKP